MQPTHVSLVAAKQAATALRQLMNMRSEDADLASFGGEVLKAVEQLKLVAWNAIHKERFWITPAGLFNELVRGAETLVNRQAGDAERRRLRLQDLREHTCGNSAREDGEGVRRRHEAPHPSSPCRLPPF